MPDLVLHVGSRNYSSWSVRAWLAMLASGLPFTEVLHDIDSPEDRTRIRALSPAGKVPFLVHGDTQVWDSLAICEYLAELAPASGLWPEAREARAAARSACAEMHSGFLAMRQAMPMNVRRSSPGLGQGSQAVADDIARIQQLWRDLRSRHGGRGPFLFGRFGIVDCTFAPVASRFRTYRVGLDETARAYTEALWAHPLVARWDAEARAEKVVIPRYDL